MIGDGMEVRLDATERGRMHLTITNARGNVHPKTDPQPVRRRWRRDQYLRRPHRLWQCVRIGVIAPKDLSIHRKEVWQEIQAEKLGKAAATDPGRGLALTSN